MGHPEERTVILFGFLGVYFALTQYSSLAGWYELEVCITLVAKALAQLEGISPTSYEFNISSATRLCV